MARELCVRGHVCELVLVLAPLAPCLSGRESACRARLRVLRSEGIGSLRTLLPNLSRAFAPRRDAPSDANLDFASQHGYVSRSLSQAHSLSPSVVSIRVENGILNPRTSSHNGAQRHSSGNGSPLEARYSSGSVSQKRASEQQSDSGRQPYRRRHSMAESVQSAGSNGSNGNNSNNRTSKVETGNACAVRLVSGEEEEGKGSRQGAETRGSVSPLGVQHAHVSAQRRQQEP
eukprot:776594-Rhodomonas_salina.1